MSTKEMADSILCTLNEEYLKKALDYLQYLRDEAEDDAYCEQLLQDYLNDPDPRKHDSVSLEEAMELCGVTADDLQNID